MNLVRFYCLCYLISIVILLPNKLNVHFCLWNVHTQVRNKDLLFSKFVLLSFCIFRIYLISCRWPSQRIRTSRNVMLSSSNKFDCVNFDSHSLALERGGGILLLMAAKRLIEKMSGSAEDKLKARVDTSNNGNNAGSKTPSVTAPMANASKSRSARQNTKPCHNSSPQENRPKKLVISLS